MNSGCVSSSCRLFVTHWIWTEHDGRSDFRPVVDWEADTRKTGDRHACSATLGGTCCSGQWADIWQDDSSGRRRRP